MKTKIIILTAALTLGLGTWNFGLGTLFAQNIGINSTGNSAVLKNNGDSRSVKKQTNPINKMLKQL